MTMQVRSVLHDRRGYSLGELLWVIVILGVLTALAVPKLDWIKYRLNAEQRNISLQLSYAQRLAVSLQHNVQVTIDAAARRLIVDEDADNDGTYGASERRRVVQLDDGLNFARNGVADLPAPAPTTELTRIIYRRDGSADQAGVLFMNTVRGVLSGSNKDARALEITRATGRATTYRYLNDAWVKGT
jgi:Tfp pilus assembly protein FimT